MNRIRILLLCATFAAFGVRADYPVELLKQQRIEDFHYNSELEGVRLAIDGDTFVSGIFTNPTPVARVFVRQGTNWQLQATLQSDESGEDYGFAESVEVDGDTIAVGAPIVFGPAPPGVYVFVRDGTNWTRQARIESLTHDEFFGSEVLLDGDTLAVGASSEGTTTVFVRVGTNWVQQARIVTNSRNREGGVALDGDTLVVADGNSSTFGAAYVYVRQGTNWTLQTHLTTTDTGTPSVARRSVGVSGDTITVGEYHNSSAGRAYVYVRSGTNWTRQARLATTDTPAATAFAYRVALEGNLLLVSAYTDSTFGSSSGAAYLYERMGTNWTQRAKLTANDAAALRYFGTYAALSGRRIAVSDYEAGVYVFEPDYLGVRNYLYYSDAAAAPGFDKNLAAFRYKELLYGRDTNDLIRARFNMMSDFYGNAERDRSFVAQGLLLDGLAETPDNPIFRNLLLDLYYDRSAAQAIFAKDILARAEIARFGPTIAPLPPASGFLIDNEIPLYEQALATNRFALQEYFDVLQLPLTTGAGVDSQFGFQVFQDLVATRGQMPAFYLDTNGVPHSVLTNGAPLFSGYKDLVLLFDLLRDHGRIAAELGRLRFARNGAGDLTAARQAVGDAQRFLYLQGSLLLGIVPNPPPEGDPSGVAEAIAGWNASLTSLNELQQALAARANPLGFEPDFLMLAQRISTPSSNYFDSFDSFAHQLDPAASTSPLKVALDAFNNAQMLYNTYRGYQDQLHEQIEQSIVSYESRLAQIVGVYPDDADYSDNPTNNPGSELDQQYRSIELARLRILRNGTEISNLTEQVEIELSRLTEVTNAVVRYGDMQAELTQTIGHIKAAQSFFKALADTFSPEKLLTRGIVFGLLNTVVQAGGEEGQAYFEGKKEKLAAEQQAVVEGINAAAHIQTLLLGLRTLEVDSQEAAVLMQQEVARLAALFREKQQLEARIAERNADLASRYYADPIHRITAESSLITANFAFDEAEKWVFFLTRAFYYKWNTPFTNYTGRSWNTNSVFKVRNALELRDLYLALVNKNDTIGLGLSRDDAQTTFSVRKDFYGFADGFTYTDPATLEDLSALEAFRRKLKTKVVTNLTDVRMEIDFSTVREKDTTSFFLGPRFNLSGMVISPGRYLDKIIWLKIKIPGNHTVPFTQANGDLTYGGTSYIRRQNPGQLDPLRPDHLRREMTAFSTRFWFFDTSLDRFRFNEGFISSGVQIELSPNPDIEPSVAQINDFVERSVAASNWHLSIPIHNLNTHTDLLRIADVDDILIFFKHQSVSRQLPP